MMFSIIIPVYNRPEEIRELLNSLDLQTYSKFEVVIIEDGSEETSEDVVQNHQSFFPIIYLSQENKGQGFARNKGMENAKGDFYIILDSDVILPQGYLESVRSAVLGRKLDAFGGPDRAMDEFSDLQKAMDFAMTSFWTTGGIRGKMKSPDKYQARGYNMGVSAEVFKKTGGFLDPNRGEDIEWSLRIKKLGYKLELVEDAYVFHKRKSDLKGFAKQAYSFGENRVNVSRFHPEAIQLVHILPSLFLFLLVSIPLVYAFDERLSGTQIGFLILWSVGIFIQSFEKYRNLKICLLSWVCSVTQLSFYGMGFIKELLLKTFKG